MKLEERGLAEVVELGIGSTAKLKILRLMVRNPDHAFTMYELERRTPLKAVDIRRHVTNLENELVKHLAEFFRKIGYTR